MSRQMYWDEEAHQFFPVADVPQEPVKPTNADLIRSMTYEELAHLLIKAISLGCPPNYKKFTGCEKKCDANVVCCWLDWLKKEVEE